MTEHLSASPPATAGISTEVCLRLLAVQSLSEKMFLTAARQLHNLSSPVDQQQALIQAGLYNAQIQKFMTVSEISLEKSLRWLDQPDHFLICADDPRYPPLLRMSAGHPSAIFVQGNPQSLFYPQLAVAGSRDVSPYGEHWCQQFVQRLTARFTITSGLARGTDTIAHTTALEANGCTVAVLGSGFLDIYPKKNQRLAGQITGQGGALVSELPPDTAPVKENFLRRNRIISGLSLGVLVVEAGMRSGTLVTARHAMNQGREVFALPGALDNPGSEGTHWLIKQGAAITTCPDEIFHRLWKKQETE